MCLTNLLILIRTDFVLEDNSNIYILRHLVYCIVKLWYVDLSILFKEWAI